MSKMLPASCVAGVVTVDGLPIPGAVILSQGVGPSTGVVVIDESTVTYVAMSSPDLKTALEKVITALEKTVTALNNAASGLGLVDGKPQGTLTPVLVAASNITAIGTNSALITAAKVELETLKGMLR